MLTRRPDAGRPKARVPVVEVRSNTQGSGRAMCELLRAPIREGLDDRFGDGCVALPRVNLSHGVDIRALAAIDERDARRRSGRDCRECVRGEPARWLAAIRFLRRALRWARRRVLVRAVSGARIASLFTSIGAHRCHSLFYPCYQIRRRHLLVVFVVSGRVKIGTQECWFILSSDGIACEQH